MYNYKRIRIILIDIKYYNLDMSYELHNLDMSYEWDDQM